MFHLLMYSTIPLPFTIHLYAFFMYKSHIINMICISFFNTFLNSIDDFYLDSLEMKGNDKIYGHDILLRHISLLGWP